MKNLRIGRSAVLLKMIFPTWVAGSDSEIPLQLLVVCFAPHRASCRHILWFCEDESRLEYLWVPDLSGFPIFHSISRSPFRFLSEVTDLPNIAITFYPLKKFQHQAYPNFVLRFLRVHLWYWLIAKIEENTDEFGNRSIRASFACE